MRAGFKELAIHCKNTGAAWVLEWRNDCEYWDLVEVSSFLKELDVTYTYSDGCVYGLMTKFGNITQMPIRKPWRVAFSNTVCLSC